MTSDRQLESRLHSIIGEVARGPYPDYIDDVLEGTARRRQRPAWTFPERWLPMDIAAQPLRITRRVPWWGLAVLAVLIIALVGALVLAGGVARVPSPFGRAGNGLVAYATRGDISVVDALTGNVTALITGPETDADPVFSRDGTRFVFARRPVGPSTDTVLIVARADGTGLVTLTPTALKVLAGWSFSPDGRFVTATAVADGKRQVLIAPSDGSAAPRFLDLGITDPRSPPQYRPDGSEILFTGKPNVSRFLGIHAVDPATGDVRTIVEGSAGAEAYGAAWSPDGSRVAYGVIDGVSRWTHVVGADGTGDVRLAAPADVLAVDGLAWSNDGTRIVVVEATNQDDYANRSVVVSVDGTGQRVVLDCAHGGFDCSGNFRTWSPDDSALIGSINEGETHYLADPVTGRIRPSAWGGEGEPSWQRVAP